MQAIKFPYLDLCQCAANQQGALIVPMKPMLAGRRTYNLYLNGKQHLFINGHQLCALLGVS